MRMISLPSVLTSYLFVLSALLYFVIANIFLLHHDIGWHIATGDLIREAHAIPQKDPWSFTAGDYRWLDISWLWDIAASWLYEKGGFSLLIGLTILIGASITAMLAVLLRQMGAGILVTTIGVLAVTMIFPLYQKPLDYVLSVSPQSLSLPFFMIFLLLLQQFSVSGGRMIYTLPFLMLLWVNSHGGFLLGFIVLGAYLLQAIVEKKRENAKMLFWTIMVCGGVTFINPLGIGIVEGLMRTIASATRMSITEWQAFNFGNFLPASLYVFIYIIVADHTNRRIPLALRLLALFFLWMGLMQLRNFCYFLLVSLPVLILSLEQRLAASHHAIALRWRKEEDTIAGLITNARPGRVFAPALLIVLLLISPPMMRLRFDGEPTLPASVYPVKEVEWIMAHFPAGEKIFNHWNFGSYIIFASRGALRVTVDGRAQTAYPPEFLNRIVRYGTEQELLEKYRPNVAIMPRHLLASLIYFDASPDWKLAYSGDVGNVYTRVH